MKKTTNLAFYIALVSILLATSASRGQEDDFGLDSEFNAESQGGTADDGGFSDLEKELDAFEKSSEPEVSAESGGSQATPPPTVPPQPSAEEVQSDFEQELKELDAPAEPTAETPPAVPAEEVAPVAEPEVEIEPESEEQIAEPATEPEEPLPAPTPENKIQWTEEPSSTPNWSSGVASFDEPDLSLESRLYDIYVKYYREPISDEKWLALIGERQAENYTIQSGDTLWGVSQTLFGDGFYWPKVWSLNSGITNPHLIEPGNVIRFLLGNEADAPAFAVTEADQGAPADAKSADDRQRQMIEGAETFAAQAAEMEGEANEFEVEIPPPRKQLPPVLLTIPPSFPDWSRDNVERRFDNAGIEYGRRPILDIRDLLVVDTYLQDREPAPFGTLIESEMQDATPSLYQNVFVDFGNQNVDIGETLLVVRNSGLLRKANESIDPVIADAGYRVEVLGQIQIVADEGRSVAGKNIYKAMITRLVNPMTMGSFVVEGTIDSVEVSLRGPRAEIAAQIIGGEGDAIRHVHPLRSLVFLNKGRTNGLEEGQILPVYSNRRVRDDKSTLGRGPLVGHIKIAKSSNRFATAAVVDVRDVIRSGDVTGVAQVAPLALAPSADAAPADGDGAVADDFGSDEESTEGVDEGDADLEEIEE